MNEPADTIQKPHWAVNTHYQRFKPIEERFLEKVDKQSSPNGCWLWMGTKTEEGYGHFHIRSKPQKYYMKAHRYSWELHRGPIPEGKLVLHNCPGGDNPSCVCPQHLWLGTDLDNCLDKESKGRGNQPRGEQQPKSKLTDAIVLEMRERRKTTGISYYALAKEFHTKRSTIRNAVIGKTWKHIP